MTDGKALLVGIAGGTGSGKTTVTRRILEAFGDSIVCVDMDSYYRDLSHMTLPERRAYNFDHPKAFDTTMFVEHIGLLARGEAIDKPIYNFTKSMREPKTVRLRPAPIVVVEGILVLAEQEVRNMLDMALFVDADDDIRFIRRLQRDVRERGRSLESVISQYTETVRPMHLTFVEPSKRYADVVIPHGGNNDVAVQMVISDLRARLNTPYSSAS